jgi:hypothetical protein
MPNNTNQQAINFCNAKLRPVLDAWGTAILSGQVLVQQWNAQDLVAVIPNDANLVQDGATPAPGNTADGRPPITDAQVNLMISNITVQLAGFTANSDVLLNQFLSWMVNGRSVI